MNYVNCKLCPQVCGADRTQGKTGRCGAPAAAVVSKAMIHKWEEPALAGNGGSGAIFFGGCTMNCVYCQNAAISRKPKGEILNGEQLRRLMDSLIAQGAENIDLVSPTPYLPTVLEALETSLSVPVVFNSGGYERLETLQKLEGKIDIYLPDLKYTREDLGRSLSGVKNYFPTAAAAIHEMVRQTGPAQWDGERLKRGTVIRHLILPGQVENSLRALDWIGENFAPGQVLVSLMRQYTPMPGLSALLDRRITQEEYDAVLSWMYLNDLQGFTQEAEAADRGFIPDF